MDFITKLKGLSYLGARNMAAAVRFGVRRAALEVGDVRRRRRSKGAFMPPTPPGEWRDEPGGGVLSFPEADLEVMFLAPDLVRTIWRPGDAPSPHTLSAHRFAPVEPIRAPRAREGGRKLATDEVVLEVAPDGTLSYLTPGGALLRREPPPLRSGARLIHRATLAPEERVYGLGERTAGLDLSGGSYRMWNLEAKGAYTAGQDPIYLCAPVMVGVHHGGSYLSFIDNSFDSVFEIPARHSARTPREARARFEGGALRSYLIPGPLPRALDRFGQLTGRPPLPPRWALGFHQARWSYQNDAEVRSLVDEFERHDLPLSAVHLDIHYMRGHRVFTIDEERFPDMPALARDLRERGVALVAIVDPGVKAEPGYPVYDEGRARDLFCTLPSGAPVIAPVWPGDCAFPDFTNPRTREWWGEQYRFFVDNGIAGVWQDMNEPAAFAAFGEPTLPTVTRHDMDGRGGSHLEGHNLYALLEARAGHEALRRLAPERRPWILSRAGWAGMQRYAWSWTGDNESDWWSLAQSIRIAIGLGLSGLPYTGPDIGGFGGKPTPELFVRWFQVGALLPFFRVHSAFFTLRREPWCFGSEVLPILRKYLKLRVRLLPYLYTLAFETSESGAPLVRPMFYENEEDPALWDVDDQFLLGSDLLVAPILEPGATRRKVYFPPGCWCGLWDERCYEGGREAVIEAPLDTLPLFVRAGAVLPMEEEGVLVLHVWPMADGGAAGGRLYSDAGDGYGSTRQHRFALIREGARLVLEHDCQGDYRARDERVDVVVRGRAHGGAPPRRATVDGREVALSDGRISLGTPGTKELRDPMDFSRITWEF